MTQNKLRIVPPPVVQNEILSSPAANMPDANILVNGGPDTKKTSDKRAKTTSKRPSKNAQYKNNQYAGKGAKPPKTRPQLLGAETTISNIIVGREDDNSVFVPKQSSAHSSEPDLLSTLESEAPPSPSHSAKSHSSGSHAKRPNSGKPESHKPDSDELDHDRLNWDQPDPDTLNQDALNTHSPEHSPVPTPVMVAPPPSLSIPELPINHTGTLGSLLRTRRESLGLPMDQVSSELRISRSHLYNLEADEYQKLPARAYAVGFVQAYAKHLGLDQLDITARFKQEIDAEEIGQPTHQFPTDGLRNHVPGKAILAGSVLLAALVYFIWVDSGPRSFVDNISWFSTDERAFMDENPSGQIEAPETTTGAAAETATGPIEADQPDAPNTTAPLNIDTPLNTAELDTAEIDTTTPDTTFNPLPTAEIDDPAPAAADPLQDPLLLDTQMGDEPIIEDQIDSVQIADIDVPDNQAINQPAPQVEQGISTTPGGSTGFADPSLVADANVWIRVLDAEQTIIYQGILLKEQRLPVQPDWRMTYSDGANLSLWIGAESIGKLENENGITAENVLVQSRLISQ